VLYGAPTGRRVVSEAAPLAFVAPPPVQKTVDATLPPGAKVIDDPGVPAQTTSARRRVYSSDGRLLSDQTWYSSYRAEPKLVRVGPKKKTKPKPTAPAVVPAVLPAVAPVVGPDAPH